MEMITASELARRIGVKPSYIAKLKKQGKLIFTENNLIDSDAAQKFLKENKERVTTNDNPEDEESLTFHKTQTEKWKAKNEQLEYEVKLKKYVLIQDVENDAFEIAKIFKEQILTLPDRTCNIFAAESDPMVIRNQMIKEIKKLLDELSDKLENYKEKLE